MFGQYSEAHRPEGWQAAKDATAKSGRVKRVFSDPGSVAHLWAHQVQDSARYRDNFYFEGRALYSYGNHFLVGFIMPDGVALLNVDSYSVTTSRHQREAAAATSHMTRFGLPSLSSLRDYLPVLAEGLSPAALRRRAAADDGWRYDSARRAVAEYVRRHGESGGTAYLAKLAGYTEKQFAEMIDKAAKVAKRRAEREAKAERARMLARGKAIAEMTDSEFRATWPEDGDRQGRDNWQAKACHQFGVELARLHKASKAAGYTTRTRELWRKLKLYREHAAGRDDRIYRAWRNERAAEVKAWRRGEGERPDAYRFNAFPAIKAGLERAQAREFAERHAEAFRAWQEDGAERPYLGNYEKGSHEYESILASEAAERVAFLAAFDAWQAGEGERPARLKATPLYGSPLYNRISDANRTIRDAEHVEQAERIAREREEREAAAYAEAEERRRAWLAGESVQPYDAHGRRLSDPEGGALLRIIGNPVEPRGCELETSHGASVPLTHAIKAFRFVKLIRESGRVWQRNGKQVRVGHYQIDRIDSEGFNAGCHRINWPEIERVAKLAGVFDCPPSDAAEEQKESA